MKTRERDIGLDRSLRLSLSIIHRNISRRRAAGRHKYTDEFVSPHSAIRANR